MQVGRKPDFKVSVVEDGKYYKVGGAWLNKSGTISIKLSAYVAIPPSLETTIMLIPSDYIPKATDVERKE